MFQVLTRRVSFDVPFVAQTFSGNNLWHFYERDGSLVCSESVWWFILKGQSFGLFGSAVEPQIKSGFEEGTIR